MTAALLRFSVFSRTVCALAAWVVCSAAPAQAPWKPDKPVEIVLGPAAGLSKTATQ